MLNEREQFWIRYFGTYDNGYNLDRGGGGIRGYSFTSEQKKHISDALKGRTFSEDTKALMKKNHAHLCGEKSPSYGVKWADRVSPEKQFEVRKRCSVRFSGSGNPNYGKKVSDEQKAKLGIAHKRYYATHENPLRGRKRPELSGAKSYRAHTVVCVNTGEWFDTIDEAATKYHISQSDISMCCSGKNHSAGKDKNGNRLLWKYGDEYVPMSSDELTAFFNACDQKRYSARNKQVECITTGEHFPSMKEACEKYHIDQSSLSGHCKGRKCVNGVGRHPETDELLKWRYIE